MAAEAGAYEEMLRVVDACAARIRWRLRPHSKLRLLNDRCPLTCPHALSLDILFLCTGSRSVILMDHGGTMPQLQESLCTLLHHARQETSILNPLRVMAINDMLLLIHVKGLAEHASPNASGFQTHKRMALYWSLCPSKICFQPNSLLEQLKICLLFNLERQSIQRELRSALAIALPTGPHWLLI